MNSQIRNLIVVFVIFLLVPVCSNGQKVILLKQYGKKQTVKLVEGSPIKLSYHDDFDYEFKTQGIITKINKDSFYLNYSDEIFYDQINTIYIKRHLLSMIRTLIGAGGTLYIVMPLTGYLFGEKPNYEPSDFIISGSLIATSGLLSIFTVKRYKLNNPDKYALQVLDFDFE